MIIVVRQPRRFSVTPRTTIVRISAIWPMLITGMIQLPGMPTPPAADVGAEKRAGPVEVQVVHGRIDERHEPEHQDERVREQLHRFEPGELARARWPRASAACAAASG